MQNDSNLYRQNIFVKRGNVGNCGKTFIASSKRNTMTSLDWGSNGTEKDLFRSILDFYKNQVKTNAYCFWMEPMKVGPGEAQKKADELHRKMLIYIRRFEKPRDE